MLGFRQHKQQPQQQQQQQAPPSPRSSMSAQTPLPESEEYEAHQVMKGHQDFVRSVEALNGVCVVSSADDKLIKLWNSTNGALLGTLEGHTTWVACVCPLLPRTDADPEDPMAVDQLLASGSFDTSIKVGVCRASCIYHTCISLSLCVLHVLSLTLHACRRSSIDWPGH
jgi:WD40 repeat protein